MNSTNTIPGLTSPAPLAGLHHVTGITGDVQANIDFYTRVLGLRLVKVTVNYDDPASYHVYYGDGLGRPGTALTFFGWPGGRRGSLGTGQVSETAFAIPRGSAAAWKKRLAESGVAGVQDHQRFAAPVVTFTDPDGLPLALAEADAVDDMHFWNKGGIPKELAIRGFYGVTLAENFETLPQEVLQDRFAYALVGREAHRVRYQATGDASHPAGRIVDVVALPQRVQSRMGVGQIHHVAFRTPDDAQQALWLEQLRRDGRNASPVMDRDYFHSIYFREPGGTLFEIATDKPGFTLNERPEELGTHLVLPAWLESDRARIQAALPKVQLALPMEL